MINALGTLRRFCIEVRDDEERSDALTKYLLTGLLPIITLIGGNLIRNGANNANSEVSENMSYIISGSVVFLGYKLFSKITSISKRSIGKEIEVNDFKGGWDTESNVSQKDPVPIAFRASKNRRKRRVTFQLQPIAAKRPCY